MDKGPLLLSFEVATIATLIVMVVGVGVAALLANYRFPGRDMLDVFFTAPIVMPPTVLGYHALVVLGVHSPLGRAFEAVTGTTIVFTKVGAVLAACIGAIPLVVKSARAAFEQTDPTLVLAARTLGASGLRAFFTVQLPLASRGIVAAAMLAFARSLGDFGLTWMIGGNLPGRTRTAAIQIYDDIQAQRESQALWLSMILTVIAVVLLYVVGKLTARERS